MRDQPRGVSHARPRPAGISRGSSPAAHRGDADAANLDLLAQAVHIHLDRVVADFLAPFAQVIDELLLRYEPPAAREQDFSRPTSRADRSSICSLR
jgi:hypothetical protein